VLDWVGLDAPSDIDGRSIRPTLAGASTRELVVSEFIRYGSERTAVSNGMLKWIEGAGFEELYDLEVDPLERRNLFGRAPEGWPELRDAAESLRRQQGTLRQRLRDRGFYDQGEDPAAPSKEVEEQLRALGYGG